MGNIILSFLFGKGEGVFVFTFLCFTDDIIIIIENLTISFVGKNNKKKLHWIDYNNLLFYVNSNPSSKPQFHERVFHCF